MSYLKKLRKTKTKLTQTQVADELGVSRGSVALWESGQSKPKQNRWQDIAMIYGVTLSNIRDGLLGTHEALLEVPPNEDGDGLEHALSVSNFYLATSRLGQTLLVVAKNIGGAEKAATKKLGTVDIVVEIKYISTGLLGLEQLA